MTTDGPSVSTGQEVPAQHHEVLTVAERQRVWRLGAIPMVLAFGALIGQVTHATLANELPLLLIALAPTDPFLILTVSSVPTWAFFVVGFTRLVLPDPFLYRLGSEFGPVGRRYVEAEFGPRNSITRAIDFLERWFPRFGLVLIAALPNYPICLLSGISRVRPWLFALLNACGTAGRLYVIWHLGRLFEGPIGRVVDLLGRFQLPVFVVMVGLVAFQSRSRTQQPPGSAAS